MDRNFREGRESLENSAKLEREVHHKNEVYESLVAYIPPVQKYQNILFNLKRARIKLSDKTLRILLSGILQAAIASAL